MIIAGSEGGENGGEGVNHGAIVLGGHGADKDGVEVINVGHKNILHRPEGADGEGTRKIGVHGAGGEVGECCEAEDVVGTTDFFDWWELVDLAACLKNGRLEGSRRASTLSVSAHVAFVRCGRQWEMCSDKAC